jgi:putative restriction endonuclease
VVDLFHELSKRESLMHALATEFAQNAVLTSRWLSRVDFGWGPERVKDVSKGIWNPSAYAATLTIVSDPQGRYDDGDHGDSLYRYSYETRPAGQDPRGGSNAKLREAMRLGLPIVMLRKVADGKFG